MKKTISIIALIFTLTVIKAQPFPYRTVECGNLKTNYGITVHIGGYSTGTVTLKDNDYFSICNPTITLTLPDATLRQGQVYGIKNGSSTTGTLIPATTLSQTVSGFTLSTGIVPNAVLWIISDGANWQCIDYYKSQNN